jgi:plastocyanin
MKKIYFTLLLTILTVCLKATSYTITIVGTYSYSPPTLTVSVGDVVTIQASTFHPLIEVSQADWIAGTTNTLSAGFGTKISNYTFTITSTNTIYYMCKIHGPMGLKGQIIVNSAGISELNNSIGNVSLFPNPAKEKVSVKFKSSENVMLTAKLYSVCGQEVQSLITNKEFFPGDNSFTFELQNNIPSGVYFMELNCNSKKTVKKIIVQ